MTKTYTIILIILLLSGEGDTVEYVGIESIKNAYRDVLQSRGQYHEASLLEVKDFQNPIFEGYSVHPEAEPSLSELNNVLEKIRIDLTAVDAQLSSVAQMYNDLMEETLVNLAEVDEIIAAEKERIQDINIIAGNLNEFTSIKTLKASDLSGTCSMEDEYTFMCTATDRVNAIITIQDVYGNGYEGNSYVYSNGTFERDVVDASVRDKMIDEYSTTYYEYSRITMPEKQEHYPVDVNFDDYEAECTVVISSEGTFNSLRLESDFKNVSIEQISVSHDGGSTYVDTMAKPIQILNPTKKYEDNSYIFGSGILSFPTTNFAKIRLKSNGVLENETLAFSKVVLDGITFLKDVKFNVEEYINEYLVPAFIIARSEVQDYRIPVSVFLAVVLERTGVKPVNVGAFNFWSIAYDSKLTGLPEDVNKCAFQDKVHGCTAAINFVLQKETAQEITLVTRSSYTQEQYNELGRDILALLNKQDGVKVTDELKIEYYNKINTLFETHNLQKYDFVENQEALSILPKKYEQYFIRFDKQEDSYEQSLKNATTVISLPKAKRHVIRINDIMSFKNTFTTDSYLETEELIINPVDCIAVFANEYLPPTFPTNASVYNYVDYLTYFLTVNEKEYEIVPVNSHKIGTKIIRYSNYTFTENYTIHIKEPIKSARLKVRFLTPNESYTPYLSNLKVCLGKAVTT